MQNKRIFLAVISLLLVGLFVYSTLRNLSFPLMWGDEAETAVFARRILSYGYPKIHDQKNAMWSMVSGDVGRWEKYDAYTGNMWGQYYFATLGEYFARSTDDFYQKTAYLRLPFALAGLLGVLILPFAVLFGYQKGKLDGWLIYIGYICFQLFSISLPLHLREVRSYSLAVLFCSIIIVLFNLHYFRRRFSKTSYTVLVFVSFVLLGVSFPPAFMAILISLGSYILIDILALARRQKGITSLKNIIIGQLYLIIPLIASIIVIFPIMVLFGVTKTASHAYADMSYGPSSYLNHIGRVLSFLFLHNFLLLALFQKTITYFLLKKIKMTITESKISNFLSYLFIVYVLMVATTPYLFDRYFIFLQPLLLLIIVIDFTITLKVINSSFVERKKINYLYSYFLSVFIIFTVSLVPKLDSIMGHIFELRFRYVGPIDEIINFINKNYSNSKDLVISTNLEETSYIYYLDSQLFCDETLPCSKPTPDIIIPRKYMIGQAYISKVNEFTKNSDYQIVSLPVLDYPSNNIPEFSLPLRHLYKTPVETNPEKQVRLYIKKN